MLLTLGAHRQERELLLIVQPTKKLPVPEDKLVSLLKPLPADDATEALLVIDEAGRPHDELIPWHTLKTAVTFGGVVPGHIDSN